MKIALIDPSLFTWPYDHALAEGLRANGHEVMVFTRHLAPGEPGQGGRGVCELFYPGFQRRAMKSLPHPLFLALKGLCHPLSLLMLLRRLRQWQPDVIHFQWAPLPVVDKQFIAAFRRIAPTVLTVHDSAPFNNNPRSKLQRIGAFEIMPLFDRLIVHTEHARRALLKHNIPSEKLVRIAHGVLDADKSTGIAPPAATIQAGEPVNLLLFGKLKPYKGADILIRALAEMAPEVRARCMVRVVGQAQMETAGLFALAKELGVEANITWDLRFVDDAEMTDIFTRADVMVMPYREIDASGVLMVALAVGRPIVASRIGLFAELIEDGKHGYLVLQEDPKGLAAALTALIENGPQRLEMGAAVRALGASIPSWSEIARTTEQLYLDIKAERAKMV